MLRIAKIVVIYKNNIEENINRYSCCSEYTYCLHLLPWVARVRPFLLFCSGVGRGESGECNPSYFSKTMLRVFRWFATKFSVRYVYLFLPYPLLILKSQLSRLTRAPLGGGGGLFRAPPLVFLRYLLNRCRYHRQTCSTLSPNIFTHCVKILKSRVS